MRRIRALFWGPSGYYALGLAPEGWNRRYLSVLEVLPFVTLGLATVLSQLQPYPREADRLVVVGLAALASIWVLVFYTWRRPQWRQPTGLMLVYFVGLLILGWLLEARSGSFIAFVIVGFLQASIVFPAGLAAVAAAATSCAWRTTTRSPRELSCWQRAPTIVDSRSPTSRTTRASACSTPPARRKRSVAAARG